MTCRVGWGFHFDGAMGKRGKTFLFFTIKMFIVKKLQGATGKVEEWSYKQGFKFSVYKTKAMILRGKELERKSSLSYTVRS